jgi:hypothetical protein
MVAGADRPEPVPAVSRLVFADSDSRWISARTNEHKYLLNVRPDRRREVFYDLVRDPGEREPLALPPGDAEELAALDHLRQALASEETRERALHELYGSSADGTIEVPEDIREQLRSLGYVP